MSERFYMVLGRGMPTFRHATYQAAEQEAQRLARQDRGQEFIVLAAMSKVKVTDVVIERLGDPDDDLPF